MNAKPWSQDYNPRRDGEHVADWLRREVALIEKLSANGKGARLIQISAFEASTLLAMIPQPGTEAAHA